MKILKEMKKGQVSDFAFPGAKRDQPLSGAALERLLRRAKVDVTVHGFRSSFRDWCGERTDFPREVAEAALATWRVTPRSEPIGAATPLKNAVS